MLERPPRTDLPKESGETASDEAAIDVEEAVVAEMTEEL